MRRTRQSLTRIRQSQKAYFCRITCRILCLLLCLTSVPACRAWAGGPLISGTETEFGPAEGPGLDDENGQSASSGAEETAGFTEEELNDSVIEYRELEALIRAGNSRAINQQASYEASLEIYQIAYDSFASAGRDMLDKADELEDEGGDAALIASYEQSAAILSSSAGQMKRSITSLNSRSDEWSREQAIWTLVKSAQSLMASCKAMEAQARSAAAREDASQAAYDRTASMKAAGLATQEEVMNAAKSLLAAQIASQSANDSADRMKRQLLIMLGKESGESAGISLGEIPRAAAEELNAIHPEEDRSLAVIADPGVKSARRSQAQGDTQRKLRSQQIEEAKGAANLTLDEQYREIAALSLKRDAAAAACAAAEKDYGALKTRYQAGLINKSEYLQGAAQYWQTKASGIAAEGELRVAVDAYGWLLKGVG